MEMKELYPKLPTAPPIEDQGQGYRLQKINEIQAFLEKEVEERGKLSKKYFRAAKIVDGVDTVLITITIGAGGESPFGGWLKRTIQRVRFKTPKYNCSFSCIITNV